MCERGESEVSEISPAYNTKPLKHLNRVAIRPTLDIEFQNLSYVVRDVGFDGGCRQILNSINGKFSCGELTAILGPSGAGKSSLLNILAGYVNTGVQGSIKVNDLPRNAAVYKKMTSYIMQDDVLQPRLTVEEAMMYAARLKLGSHIKLQDRIDVVTEVIEFLGLKECTNTYTEHLSGGQRKRLSVALELVNNPPLIFLDEPTTGLDDFAVKMCIDLLKKISKMDRTVVCTIHQPSASLFQYFDQIYMMGNGCCVYNGPPSQLVPFLSQVGYPCPSNYTPADYLMELIHSSPANVDVFKSTIQNGTINASNRQIAYVPIQKSDVDFPTSFLAQFSILISRSFLQMRRNKIGLFVQILHHLLSAAIVASIFQGIGNNATQAITILKYIISCNVFFLYTYVMTPVLLFPLEVELLKREYFNRWYGLRAYYSALLVVSFPLLVVLSFVFSAIIYFFTDQPKEMDRFFSFGVVNFMMGLTSQSLGYFIGSMFSITGGAVVGPSTLAVLLVVGVYGLGFRANIPPVIRVLMKFTFFRNGVVGIANTLFDQRERLECNEEALYCHFADPKLLMNDNSIAIRSYWFDVAYMLVFAVLFRIMTYVALKCRLSYEIWSKVVYYVKKVMNLKVKFVCDMQM